jgi:hypothetical protein
MMSTTDHGLMNPRKLEEVEVRLLVADMVAKIPPEITLESALAMLIEGISEMSARITMFETSTLIGIAATVTKAVAANRALASTPIAVAKETCQ